MFNCEKSLFYYGLGSEFVNSSPQNPIDIFKEEGLQAKSVGSCLFDNWKVFICASSYLTLYFGCSSVLRKVIESVEKSFIQMMTLHV